MLCAFVGLLLVTYTQTVVFGFNAWKTKLLFIAGCAPATDPHWRPRPRTVYALCPVMMMSCCPHAREQTQIIAIVKIRARLAIRIPLHQIRLVHPDSPLQA